MQIEFPTSYFSEQLFVRAFSQWYHHRGCMIMVHLPSNHSMYNDVRIDHMDVGYVTVSSFLVLFIEKVSVMSSGW